ncbi:MAG: N-6 DNA methylase [Candidatus Competibacteraceae bacterium]|jgi:hypothetical protein|nr:N-6 DNA methylase [Candidatus Competibacteraceae bacterium]
MAKAQPQIIVDEARPLLRLLSRNPNWRDDELLSWLLDDVLADLTGQRKPYPPPIEAIPVICELASTYRQCVIDAAPFTDLLGPLYMETTWQRTRQDRGLFFTPQPIATLMARMLLQDDATPKPDGQLWRVCEPAAGSGVMLLSFAQTIIHRFGAESLSQWSFTAVDLMADCARMTAVQLLANCHIHQLALGELLVMRGNSLAPADDMEVIVHCAAATTPAEVLSPATHPARLEGIKTAAQAAGLDLFCLPTEDTDEAA